MANPPSRQKGFFGAAGLPVARAYLHPRGRNRLLAIGAGLALLVGGAVAGNVLLQRGGLVSNGPLTSAHAALEDTCASCHTPFQPVADEKCRACHGRFSDSLGTYTFNAHYVYESGDRTRAFGRNGEAACASCHLEHTGRNASLTTVSDAQCAACHAASFAEHPEFGPVVDVRSDDPNLIFGHAEHVDRVMELRQTSNHEIACLTCHRPSPDGRRFEPIAFETQCAACHLGPDEQSETLAVKRDGVPLVAGEGEAAIVRLGVERLETIVRRRGPGEEWARAMSPASFEVDDGLVTKIGVDHRDPWVLHNLRLLRRAMYRDRGLSDLLVATPDLTRSGTRGRQELYEEAVGTLERYADGLRGEADFVVQEDLLEIRRALDDVRDRIGRPDEPLSDVRFRTDQVRTNPAVLAAVESFAAEVARPCLTCHRLERATIARVQADQQSLPRAVFDHQAHVLQRDCLSCHDRIPMLADVADIAPGVGSAGGEALLPDEAVVHNLPSVTECQTCHQRGLAADRCQTCHLFHPGTDHWSRLIVD